MEFESGIKLGKLTLIKYLGRNKHSKKVWLCQCECGNKVERVENNLKQSIKNEKPHIVVVLQTGKDKIRDLKI